MKSSTLTITTALLGLTCAGCVIAPPPPPPPAYVAAPQAAPQAAQQSASAPGNCREFQQTITIGGKPQAGYGTTCQQPDGSWKVMDQAQSSAPPAPPPPQIAAAPVYPAYAYPYPYAYPTYSYAPGYYSYGGIYVHGRWR